MGDSFIHSGDIQEKFHSTAGMYSEIDQFRCPECPLTWIYVTQRFYALLKSGGWSWRWDRQTGRVGSMTRPVPIFERGFTFYCTKNQALKWSIKSTTPAFPQELHFLFPHGHFHHVMERKAVSWRRVGKFCRQDKLFRVSEPSYEKNSIWL